MVRGSQRDGRVNLGGERTQHTHSLNLHSFSAAPRMQTTHSRSHVPSQGWLRVSKGESFSSPPSHLRILSVSSPKGNGLQVPVPVLGTYASQFLKALAACSHSCLSGTPVPVRASHAYISKYNEHDNDKRASVSLPMLGPAPTLPGPDLRAEGRSWTSSVKGLERDKAGEGSRACPALLSRPWTLLSSSFAFPGEELG